MKYSWLVLLLFLPLFTRAQTIGLWSGVDFEKKLNKSFSVNVSGQARFSDEISTLKSYLGEVGVEYKLNKHWGASVYYRHLKRRKLDKDTDEYYYRTYQRFYANITYGQKLTKWLKLDYRLRYQNQFKDDDAGLVNDGSYLRNKVELTYKNKSRFTPSVSADLFYLLGTGVDQIRLKSVVNIEVNKHNSFDVGVFTDYPILENVANNAIISVGYKMKW